VPQDSGSVGTPEETHTMTDHTFTDRIIRSTAAGYIVRHDIDELHHYMVHGTDGAPRKRYTRKTADKALNRMRDGLHTPQEN